MIIRFFYNRYKIKKKLNLFRRLVDVPDNSTISSNINFKLIEKSLEIGENSHLDGNFVTKGKGKIKMGSHCSFRQGTYIGALNSIIIGNNVFGAPNVFITDNNNHPTSPKMRKEMTFSPPNTLPWKWDEKIVDNSPIVIEDCVWLGRNSIILKGVTIGKGSIVAAGAVVTKDVPAFTVVAGNPAKVVKHLQNDLD